MKLLIIEDDKSIAELERDYLVMSGYECDLSDRGDAGLTLAREGNYALVILDLMLPGMDGFDLLRRLREETEVPVIILSAKGDDIDKIRGLGLGADDYMVKPFSPSELVARVKTRIDRYNRLTGKAAAAEISQNLLIRGLEIKTGARRVLVDGVEKTLTNKEFDLLLYLAENPDRVFSKELLFDRVWGLEALGDISTVTVHIRRIREKIEGREKFIETVWGVGYRFMS